MTIPSKAPSPFGLYIHIPFCVKKCPYCNFYSITDSTLYDPFVKSVCAEINLNADLRQTADTVYFGGGTPSVLGPMRIEKILQAIYNSYRVSPEAEITLEANPGTISKADLHAFRGIGINRINIGTQSFSDENLAFLGRCHTSRESIDALGWAKDSGFTNIGLDLIYGLPKQPLRHWKTELEKAVSFQPAHISCYMLTYEPGTPLETLRRSGSLSPMKDTELADFFTITSDTLTRAGYDHYEISNFARNISCRSRHNQKYWLHAPYTGFGPAAHSFKWPTRSWNVKSVHDYISRINKKGSPTEGQEDLTRQQLMIEALFLGLRTKEGMRLIDFEESFQLKATVLFASLIEELTQQELLTIDNHRMALTKQGMLFHDHISERFAEAV